VESPLAFAVSPASSYTLALSRTGPWTVDEPRLDALPEHRHRHRHRHAATSSVEQRLVAAAVAIVEMAEHHIAVVFELLIQYKIETQLHQRYNTPQSICRYTNTNNARCFVCASVHSYWQ
jgi:hypothetical protein